MPTKQASSVNESGFIKYRSLLCEKSIVKKTNKTADLKTQKEVAADITNNIFKYINGE